MRVHGLEALLLLFLSVLIFLSSPLVGALDVLRVPFVESILAAQKALTVRKGFSPGGGYLAELEQRQQPFAASKVEQQDNWTPLWNRAIELYASSSSLPARRSSSSSSSRQQQQQVVLDELAKLIVAMGQCRPTAETAAQPTLTPLQVALLEGALNAIQVQLEKTSVAQTAEEEEDPNAILLKAAQCIERAMNDPTVDFAQVQTLVQSYAKVKAQLEVAAAATGTRLPQSLTTTAPPPADEWLTQFFENQSPASAVVASTKTADKRRDETTFQEKKDATKPPTVVKESGQAEEGVEEDGETDSPSPPMKRKKKKKKRVVVGRQRYQPPSSLSNSLEEVVEEEETAATPPPPPFTTIPQRAQVQTTTPRQAPPPPPVPPPQPRQPPQPQPVVPEPPQFQSSPPSQPPPMQQQQQQTFQSFQPPFQSPPPPSVVPQPPPPYVPPPPPPPQQQQPPLYSQLQPPPPTYKPPPRPNPPAFVDNNPTLQKRTSLAQQLEDTLLSDTGDDDPVQVFLESLQQQQPQTALQQQQQPPVSQQTGLAQQPLTATATPPASASGSPLSSETLAVQLQEASDLAKKLEATLKKQQEQIETTPAVSTSSIDLVQQLEDTLLSTKDDPQRRDATSSRNNEADDATARIERFIQSLKSIRGEEAEKEDAATAPPSNPLFFMDEIPASSATVAQQDVSAPAEFTASKSNDVESAVAPDPKAPTPQRAAGGVVEKKSAPSNVEAKDRSSKARDKKVSRIAEDITTRKKDSGEEEATKMDNAAIAGRAKTNSTTTSSAVGGPHSRLVAALSSPNEEKQEQKKKEKKKPGFENRRPSVNVAVDNVSAAEPVARPYMFGTIPRLDRDEVTEGGLITVEEMMRGNLKSIERKIIQYMIDKAPGLEDFQQASQQFWNNTASPIVEKAVSVAWNGLSSAWGSTYRVLLAKRDESLRLEVSRQRQMRVRQKNKAMQQAQNATLGTEGRKSGLVDKWKQITESKKQQGRGDDVTKKASKQNRKQEAPETTTTKRRAFLQPQVAQLQERARGWSAFKGKLPTFGLGRDVPVKDTARDAIRGDESGDVTAMDKLEELPSINEIFSESSVAAPPPPRRISKEQSGKDAPADASIPNSKSKGSPPSSSLNETRTHVPSGNESIIPTVVPEKTVRDHTVLASAPPSAQPDQSQDWAQLAAAWKNINKEQSKSEGSRSETSKALGPETAIGTKEANGRVSTETNPRSTQDFSQQSSKNRDSLQQKQSDERKTVPATTAGLDLAAVWKQRNSENAEAKQSDSSTRLQEPNGESATRPANVAEPVGGGSLAEAWRSRNKGDEEQPSTVNSGDSSPNDDDARINPERKEREKAFEAASANGWDDLADAWRLRNRDVDAASKTSSTTMKVKTPSTHASQGASSSGSDWTQLAKEWAMRNQEQK